MAKPPHSPMANA
jgi:hypothetical protein